MHRHASRVAGEAGGVDLKNQAYITLSDADADYFTKCARIRDLSRASLLRRMLHTIAQDQLVGSILDDGDAPRKRRNGEHRFHRINRVRDHGSST